MKKLMNTICAFTMFSGLVCFFTGCEDIGPTSSSGAQHSSFEDDLEKAMQQGRIEAEKIVNSPAFQSHMKETEQQLKQDIEKAFKDVSFE